MVDLGEASSIALSLELTDNTIILDDQKARTLANNLNLKFTGLLGVILKAKQQNKIPSVLEVLNKLKSVNFTINFTLTPIIMKNVFINASIKLDELYQIFSIILPKAGSPESFYLIC